MPRISAESRSAAGFRVNGGAALPAPAHLSGAARLLWDAITAAKPVDWFDEGSGPLLEAYVEQTLDFRAGVPLLSKLRKAKADWREVARAERSQMLRAKALASLATKLRLSVQVQARADSGKLGERAAPARKSRGLLGLKGLN